MNVQSVFFFAVSEEDGLQVSLAWLLFLPIPIWRFNAEQVMHEKVVTLLVTISSAGRVACPRNYLQIELFVGLDQSVDHLHRRSRINVRIQFAKYQQQLALQFVGVVHV